MNYDDILRLAHLASGVSTGPLPPPPAAQGVAQPAPVPTPQGPPPEPYVPGSAAPGDIHALSNRVMGPPGFLERVEGIGQSVPLVTPITSLIDLAGSIVRRGRSGYQDLEQRQSIDKLQQQIDEEVRQAKLSDNRANLTARAAAIAQRISEASQRHDSLVSQRDDLKAKGLLSAQSEADYNKQINAWRQRYADLSTTQSRILNDPLLAEQAGSLEASTPGLPATPLDAITARSAAEARGTASVKPAGENPEDYFQHYGEITYLDPNMIKEAKLADQATALANKRGIPIVKDGQQKFAAFDAARANLAHTMLQASLFLPDKPLDGLEIAKNWMGQFNDADVRGFNSARASAIELVQAAANLGTGNRITTVELTNMIDSAFPRLPHLTFTGPVPTGFDPGDWKASAAVKGQFISSMLDNAQKALLGNSGAQQELQKQIDQLRKGDVPTVAPAAAASPAPAAASPFNPAAKGTPLAPDPNFDPAARGQKIGTTVKQHTRALPQRSDTTRTR